MLAGFEIQRFSSHTNGIRHFRVARSSWKAAPLLICWCGNVRNSNDWVLFHWYFTHDWVLFLQIPLVTHESFRISLILQNALYLFMNSSGIYMYLWDFHTPQLVKLDQKGVWLLAPRSIDWHPFRTAILPRSILGSWRLQLAQALVKPFLPQGTLAPNDLRLKGKDRKKWECFMGHLHQFTAWPWQKDTKLMQIQWKLMLQPMISQGLF